MAYQYIQHDTAEGVATLMLNRPEVLNSFNLEMAHELQKALSSISSDDRIRAVLLTGAGRGFCAGQDLGSVSLEPGAPPVDVGDYVKEQYNPIVRAIRTMPKPVVCAVNGVAAGAGANLALACDIVLASSGASFIQSFSKIGLIPDCGGTYFLPRLVGSARAMALAMLGDKVSATQAMEWGMIYKVHEPSALMDEARTLCGHLATQPTVGLALTKQALNASLTNDLDQQLDMEESIQRQAGRTSDFIEGVQAFMQKRKPVFRGS